MMISRLFAAGLALAGTAAAAQNYVVQPPISQTYVPLVGATTATPSESDDGFATIPLGFTFPYYGNNYTTLHANTNGFLAFGNTAVCEAGSGCYNSTAADGAIPKTSRAQNIHNLIAPWWDDLSVTTPGVIRYLQSAGQIEIEYAGVRNLGSSYTFSFTVKLTSAGTIEIKYGTTTGTGGTASMGFEDSTGTNGAPLLPCSATSAACTIANFPVNTLYVIGQPVQPDIVVTAVNISNLVVGGTGNITFDVTPTFQNYGQMPAMPAFGWKAYLSTDKVLGGDILVYTSPTNLTLAGAGTAGSTTMASGAAATTSPPPPGQYYVLVEADPAPSQVTEASELNNVGSTTNFFVNGLDLVATGITGPANSGPGNPVMIPVTWFNQGTAAPGLVGYRVLLSLDNMVGTTDFTLYSGSRTVTGGETVSETLSFNVPNNVPGGDFFYILQIDPTNAIIEANEGNNAFVSVGKVTMKQADLVNIATNFLEPLTAAATRIGYFGQPARATVSINNIGGANANNFTVCVVVSTDATLSLLSDTIVFESAPVPVVAQAMSAVVDLPFTMPLKDRNNVNFPTGNYYVYTLLDCSGTVTELNEVNNNLVVMGTVQLRAPAADLTVTKVEAPASGAVGEIIPVLRTLKNIGNVDAMAVKYQYFASANAIITPDDLPVQIISGGTGSVDGTVTLAVGAADTKTELVRLPASMPAGTYYVGVIIDTMAVVPELDETNNALASSTIAVAASSLRVSTSQLPDAVADRPYSYRLVALGEQGPTTTWALDPSQGTLPMGLTLATDGMLTGTPLTTTVSAFTVVVTNAGRDATARLVLRVLPTTTQVEITTTSVPPVINLSTQKYEFSLGAAGGVKPYAWKVIGGMLPQNLILTNDGALSGFPRVGLLEGASNVLVEVQDSLGTRAQKSLSMRVIAPGSIVFKNLNLPDGLVGEDYGTDIAVQNADLTPIAAAQKPLIWTKQGELPDGLTMSPAGDVLSIEGKPLRAGIYTFSITAEDAKGRSDTAEYLIRISPARFKLQSVGLPELSRPGDAVTFAITATSQANPKFALYSGRLAPGLTMDADGKVTGTLPIDNVEGTYNFVVEAIDDTKATGLGAFSLEVRREVKAVGCTCSSVGGSALWLLALLLPFAARRRFAR